MIIQPLECNYSSGFYYCNNRDFQLYIIFVEKDNNTTNYYPYREGRYHYENHYHQTQEDPHLHRPRELKLHLKLWSYLSPIYVGDEPHPHPQPE